MLKVHVVLLASKLQEAAKATEGKQCSSGGWKSKEGPWRGPGHAPALTLACKTVLGLCPSELEENGLRARSVVSNSL